MTLANGSKLGPYEIVGAIDAGGMGEVYRAKDTKLGRDVALKVLPEAFARDAERMARFKREAQVLASLNHPNIAAVYGFEDSSSTHALVMELVEGPTLAERISGGRKADPSSSAIRKSGGAQTVRPRGLPMEEALPIAKQIAEGLEYAHDRGIVHRDLKPSNIKLAANEMVKILDFGLAKALEREAASVDISSTPTVSRMATQEGIILGTAAYMSPEQAKGKAVDRRTDIWAFGCVLNEMLTGKAAFEGETVTDILAAIVKDEPDWAKLPAETPRRIRELLARCLVKEPRGRLQSIGEARIAFEETLSEAGTQSGLMAASRADALPQASREFGGARWRSALPWAVAGVAIALLLMVVARSYFRSGLNDESSVTRLDVSLPPGVTLVTRDSQILAISPYGRQIVFMAAKGNINQLYRRTLDEPEAKALPGTENGVNPFFSPDGKWIGFFADGKLKRIPVDGGTAQTLADAPNQRGGSWTLDGTILYSPDYTTGLMQISEAGGQPQPIITPDQAKNERTYRWPDVLPNGKGVIFTIGMANSVASYDDAEIAVYSFRTHETRVLTHGGMAIYSPSGFLLYYRGSTLSAIPFDEDRMEITGSPVQLSDAVGGDQTSGVAYFAVAANGTMSYLRGISGAEGRVVTIVNRKGEVHVLPLPAHGYSIPRFSPDGKRLLLIINDRDNSIVSGEGDLWIYDFGTGNLSRLTFDGGNDYPVWSSDGSTIYFDSSLGRDGSFYAKHADGTGEEQTIIKGEGRPYDPDAISPNGKIVVFTRPGGSGGDLWTYVLGDKADPKLFKSNAAGAVFSPDGNYIAYSSYQGNVYQVFVNTFPDAGGQWQVSQETGVYPKWCEGGRELVYYDQPHDRLMSVDVELKPAFHAGAPQELFKLSAAQFSAMQTNPAVNYDVSSDCQRFAFLQPSGPAQTSPEIAVTLNFPAEIRALMRK